MDLQEVIEMRDRVAALSERRSAMAAKARDLLQAARTTADMIAPEPGSDTGGEGLERPKYQQTPWVVVKRDGQRVLCGSVEVRNYSGDGKDDFELDGEVKLSFIDGTLVEAPSDDTSEDLHSTASGESFTGGEDGAFAYEIVSLATLSDALDAPSYYSNQGSEPLDSYEPKLSQAEALLASANTSLRTVVEGWQSTTLNPR